MTTSSPGITDPENVDSLTHQQIYDAFQTVDDRTAQVVTSWQQTRDRWRDSTTEMVQAVRTAVDGRWTGASADAAVQALVGYGTQAGQLADLFDQAGQAVANTALAAVTTKAYVPKPVPVTADQTKDPTGYDGQSRAAQQAQDDARQVMQQRYLIPLLDQDARIPAFPPAVSPASDPGAAGDIETLLASAGFPGADIPATLTAALSDSPLGAGAPTTPSAATGTSLFGGLPHTGRETDPSSSVYGTSTSTTSPSTTNSLFGGPRTSRPSSRTPANSTVPGADTAGQETSRPQSGRPSSGEPAPDRPDSSTSSTTGGTDPVHTVPDSPLPEISTVAPEHHHTPATTSPDSDATTSSGAHSATTSSGGSPGTGGTPQPSNPPASPTNSPTPGSPPPTPAPSAPATPAPAPIPNTPAPPPIPGTPLAGPHTPIPPAPPVIPPPGTAGLPPGPGAPPPAAPEPPPTPATTSPDSDATTSSGAHSATTSSGGSPGTGGTPQPSNP
ncbi:hypothetical protein, partial [Nocardia wallacei]|uniref:hypothetical protein n=1 Tax=Nocardia wallacei TaxID=480035 RepID=UPI003CC7E70E